MKQWRHFVVGQPSIGGSLRAVTTAHDQTTKLQAIGLRRGDANVQLFEDATLQRAKDEITSVVEACGRDDQLLLSFVGHGVTAGSENNPFIPREYWLFDDGGLCDQLLFQHLAGLAPGAEAVVLSDACRGGGMFGDWQRIYDQLLTVGASRRSNYALTIQPLDGVRYFCEEARTKPDDRVTLLLMAPVNATLNTTSGFTGQFADAAPKSATYGELRDRLIAAGFKDTHFLVLPRRETDRVLNSRPFERFNR